MFSNILKESSPVPDNTNLNSIYSKLQNFLGRTTPSYSETKKYNMLSSRASTVASDDTFITPVSSVGDLLSLSPKQDVIEHRDVTNDLITGDFNSICDVTMEEVPNFEDNLYIDATGLDYLVKCGDSNRHNIRDRGKESLFVKFDPLYAKKLNTPSLTSTQSESAADSTEVDGGYETGSAVSGFTDLSITEHGNSTGSMTSICVNDGVCKPMQVVPPVRSSEGLKASISQTRTTPALVRSVSAILTPTQVTTERLISISGNTPPIAAPRSPRYNCYTTQEVDKIQTLTVILQKKEQEVFSYRQENRELKSLLKEEQYNHSKAAEELGNLKIQFQKLNGEKKTMLERENKLLQQINDKIMANKKMCIVMEEYEKTITSLISERQKDIITSQETIDRLTNEKNQSLNHLTSMESSFNDLLSKYERCKTVIQEYKDREKIFEQNIEENAAGIKKYESLYNNLKQVTNDAMENLKKNHNAEIAKMNANIKKHEITIASLQESVDQKVRDIEELTKICDQLINQV